MRITNILHIQFIIEYLNQAKASKKIRDVDYPVFWSWLQDAPLYSTTQTAVGKRVGKGQQQASKSFERFVSAGLLDQLWVKGKPIKVDGHTIPQFKLGAVLLHYFHTREKELKNKRKSEVVTSHRCATPPICDGSHPTDVLHRENNITVVDEFEDGFEYFECYL